MAGLVRMDDQPTIPLAEAQAFVARAAETAKSYVNGQGRLAMAPLLPFKMAGEFNAILTADDFIPRLLIGGQSSLLYGESGCGKTFFATDLAMHLAYGMSWRGRDLEPSGVLYVAAEGAYGISNRIAAFRQHHACAGHCRMAVVTCGIDLLRPEADRERVAATARHIAENEGGLRLVVIDTVARALAGGDENSPEAMGALVASIDYIREATGAHVMGIHHSGKDASKGARGHSSLRAAVDTEIFVAKLDSYSTACVTKQRDLATEGEFHFCLDVIELGLNSREEAVTSCVVREIGGATQQQRKTKVRLNKSEKRALDVLRDELGRVGQASSFGPDHVPAGKAVLGEKLWRAAYMQRTINGDQSEDARRKGFVRAADSLVSQGMVGTFGGEVWLS